MVALIGFEGDLLDRLEVVLLEVLNLGGEDGLGGHCRVDTAGFDGDDNVASFLEETLSVVDDDTGLIRLGDISKDNIDQREEHAVFVR